MTEGASKHAAGERRSTTVRAWVIVLVLACALALVRFLRLGAWGLWIDEAYTLADYHHSLEGGENFNPLGYLAIGATVKLLGGVPDELALRFLPALVGVACVPLAWWAFHPLAGPRRAALAALLLSLSSWHVFWSQSARFYTLAQAVSLVGAGLLVRGLWTREMGTREIGTREIGRPAARPRLGLVLAGVLVAAFAASFHPSAAFLLPGFCVGAWLLWWLARGEERARWRPPALLFAGLALAGLLLLAFVGWGILDHHRSEKPVGSALSGVVHMLQTTAFFFTPVWVAGALFGASEALRRRESAGLFILATVAVTLTIPLAIATQAQMTAQYVFVLLPWVALLACVPLGAESRPGAARAFEFGYLGVLILPTIASLGLYFTVREGERAPWRAAYHYVSDRRAEGDLVLGMGDAIAEYYLGHGSTDLRRPIAIEPLAEFFPHGPRRWTRHQRRIWVVVRPQWIEGFRPQDQDMLRDWLADECRVVARFGGRMEGRDLDVLVYLRE